MKAQHKKIMYGALGVCCLAALGLTLGLVDCEGSDDTTRGDSSDQPAPLPQVDDVLTVITDPAFNAFCVGKMGSWDTDGDGKLSPEEAAAGAVNIDMSNLGIKSLAGVEYFKGLRDFWCANNDITGAVNLPATSTLLYFNCSGNSISSIDVSGCPGLLSLSCEKNMLSSLDVSKNTKLSGFDCSDNNLSSIDVSKNIVLQDFKCYNNKLTSLDVSNNPKLTRVKCEFNRLATLDVSNNTDLQILTCQANRLTGLDISKNTELTTLVFIDNPGNGSEFVIKSWFDGASIPEGFPTTAWYLNAKRITPTYQKVS